MNHTAFGLIIESELELPELFASNGQIDAAIVFGKVPEHLETPVEKTPWFEVAGGKFLLRVDGIAKYYVENGNMIVIDPEAGTNKEDVRVFLLNTVIAALLQQRDYLILHGSVALINGKAVALVGPSRSGKTAIALSLYEKGYQILSDEICAIKTKNGKVLIYPGIPQLNVWHDTLAAEGKNVSGCQPIRRGLEKFAFRVEDRFCRDAFELSDIIFLKHHNKETMLSEALKGGEKLEHLLKNTYFVETTSDKVANFQVCGDAVNHANIMKVTFNNKLYQVDKLTNFIIKKLK
ncbi:MAG: hypothetical protein WA705_23960 [Candidatus Ozemobacteraceae bacterium]